MAVEGDVALDPVVIKALSADTRRQLLKRLTTRRHTVSELAHELGLNKATVYEHLQLLTNAGLVKRREDERLWVYYELTHRGGLVINPGTTSAAPVPRYFYAVGTFVALGMVALLAFGILSSMEPETADREPAASHLLVSAPKEASTAQDAIFQISALDADGDAVTARLFLVPEDKAGDLAASDPAALSEIGYVVSDFAYRDSRSDSSDVYVRWNAQQFVTTQESTITPPGGKYYVVALDQDGRTNLGSSLPTVVLPNWTHEASHQSWMRGLDGNATFRYARDGIPLNGTLVLADRQAPNASVESPIVNGVATFAASALDALPDGIYTIAHRETSLVAASTLPGTFRIRPANVAVLPGFIDADEPATLSLYLPPGADLPTVRWEGIDVPVDNGVLAGSYVIDVPTQDEGRGLLQVGRTHQAPIDVDAPVLLEFDASQDLLTVTHRAQPLVNASIDLDGAFAGSTDPHGSLHLPLSAGSHVLSLTLPDGGVRNVSVVRQGALLAPAPPPTVRSNGQAITNDTVYAGYALVDEARQDIRGTLVVYVDGRPWASQRLDMDATSPRDGHIVLHNVPQGSHTLTWAFWPAPPVRILPAALPGAPAPSTTAGPSTPPLLREPEQEVTIDVFDATRSPRHQAEFVQSARTDAAKEDSRATPSPSAWLIAVALIVGLAIARRLR